MEIIGKNIRDARLARHLSQEKLAKSCGFSNTTLSAYENGKKIPSLATAARIAKELNVSIEQLYYGDENTAFILREPDIGRKIVNSLYFLWSSGIIDFYQNLGHGLEAPEYAQSGYPRGYFLAVKGFEVPIRRLLYALNEFNAKRGTYSDPEKYLEMILSSVANEINQTYSAKTGNIQKE